MESTEQMREIEQFNGDRPSVVPAVISCVAGVVGLLAIAASPWLILTSDLATVAAKEPAFQAARAFPSVVESKRTFDERRQPFEAGRQGGTQETGSRLLVASPSRRSE